MTAPEKFTRAQVSEAVRLLGLDPDEVTSVVLWPDHVSWETLEKTEAGDVVWVDRTAKVVMETRTVEP